MPKLMSVLMLSLGLETRIYHVVPLPSLAVTSFTHVQVCGLVAFVKREGDGDVHVRMEDRGKFIVAEIIPFHPLPAPKVGRWICVRGISREDKTHHWYEVNLVEAWWYAR